MYEGLRFSFAAMDKEIDSMNRLSRRFLTVDSSERIIPNWRRELGAFRSAPSGTPKFWQIGKTDPIETTISKGEYEGGARRGKLQVFGKVSGIWEVQLPNEVKKRSVPSKEFTLLGLASTEVSIWNAAELPAKEIARWTIEIGDATSPGCHFHTQITLEDVDNKFPSSLCVPRLPALLHTPMDALDFLLGELFQDQWFQNSSRVDPVVDAWASCQKSRIVNLLRWQTERLENTVGSPWTMLKRQKPGINMLIGET